MGTATPTARLRPREVSDSPSALGWLACGIDLLIVPTPVRVLGFSFFVFVFGVGLNNFRPFVLRVAQRRIEG
jgi:hypothetical protein